MLLSRSGSENRDVLWDVSNTRMRASCCLISARPAAHRAAAELPAGRDWWQVGPESISRNSASPELAPEIF